MAKLLPTCFLLICSIGVTLLIISVATDYWRSTIILGELKIRDGLFRYCMKYELLNIDKCGRKTYGELSSTFVFVTIMMIASIIFGGISLIFILFHLAFNDAVNGAIRCVSISQVLSASLSGAGLVMFYANQINVKSIVVVVEWSYIVAWVGFAFQAIGLVLVMIIGKKWYGRQRGNDAERFPTDANL